VFIIKLLSQRVSGIIMPISSQPNSAQPQPAQPVQDIVCSYTQSCSLEDWHNDARNMFR